jgi:putative transposase
MGSFIRTHLALLAGTDFTAEVLTLGGLVTCYGLFLFFIHLESRRLDIAGITVHSDEAWMKQIARNATMEDCSAPRGLSLSPARSRHEIHPVLPRHHCVRSGRTARAACSANLNAYANR